MTTEERFTRIENALAALAEHQVQHAEDIKKHEGDITELRQMHKSLVVAVGKVVESQAAALRGIEELRRAIDEMIRRRDWPNGKGSA